MTHIVNIDSVQPAMCPQPENKTNVYSDNFVSNHDYSNSNFNCTSKSSASVFSTSYEANTQDSSSVSNNICISNILNKTKTSNINRLIIGQLNVNSIRNKMDILKSLVIGNLDIFVITESKLDESFHTNQFFIDVFLPPFRLDRTSKGGGVLIYVRDDIPCRLLTNHIFQPNFEGIFLEINIRKSKWLFFGGYNPHKNNISTFFKELGSKFELYLPKYENTLLLGDFNSECTEPLLKEFCEMYNVKNLIKEPTCFENPLNPSSIDVILTNRGGRCQCSRAIETGLSDHHKLTITVLKNIFPKRKPTHSLYIEIIRNLIIFTFEQSYLISFQQWNRGQKIMQALKIHSLLC